MAGTVYFELVVNNKTVATGTLQQMKAEKAKTPNAIIYQVTDTDRQKVHTVK